MQNKCVYDTHIYNKNFAIVTKTWSAGLDKFEIIDSFFPAFPPTDRAAKRMAWLLTAGKIGSLDSRICTAAWKRSFASNLSKNLSSRWRSRNSLIKVSTFMSLHDSLNFDEPNFRIEISKIFK